jgi:hypothetical protein
LGLGRIGLRRQRLNLLGLEQTKPFLLFSEGSLGTETFLFLLLLFRYPPLLLLQLVDLADADSVQADPRVLEACELEGLIMACL